MPGKNKSYFGILKSIDFKPTPKDWEHLYYKRGETIANRDATIKGLKSRITMLENEIIKLKNRK